MMDLLQTIQANWKKEFPQLSPGNTELLLAVSGGADSVVLVDLMARMGFAFRIAHVNFQLRGEESVRDELFVTGLGKKYQTEVLLKRSDTMQYAYEQKLSVQEAARKIRYDWFETIQQEFENSKPKKQTLFLVTAHHADDNIETLLIHFFRGTGIQGLQGIPEIWKEKKIIRPLLAVKKKNLLEYALQNNLSFVEDSSNASDKYTRNFFRNQLLPQIREVFPAVEENLVHNIERFREIAAIYQDTVKQQLNRLIHLKKEECHVPVLKWKKSRAIHSITWELIRPYGFHASQIAEIIKLLDAENGGFQSSATHRIIKNRSWMIIAPLQTEKAGTILIEEGQTELSFANGHLQLIRHSGSEPMFSKDLTIAHICSAKIIYPLIFRKWKQGDYFYPLGMQKKKKLSRFFIDRKLSLIEKEKIWILESAGRIVWVVGQRMDDRFKISPATKNYLQITYRK
ncbi:MAG: tRNA lysidine(34) synthetase TilS [Bacteroidota bacterium]|jgi:tRNA(Ile)-lysidine synthase